MELAAMKNILELVGLLVWICVSGAPLLQKNPTYDILMTSLDVVRELLKSASLTFAPGLYDVLQADTPPPLAYFKSLPLVSGKWWAVYAVTLEKSGHRPKIYIGSGTNQQRGVRARMHCYDVGEALPKHFKKALDDGYEITHRGFLCWTPIPSASKHGSAQMVILAVEAMFSFYFWAMVSRAKDYCMSHACRWAIGTFEYDGCCGHSALLEALSTDGLTADQVESKISQMVQNRKKRDAKTGKDWTKANPEKLRATEARKNAKNKSLKKHYCNTCNSPFNNQAQLTRHFGSDRHKNKAAGLGPTSATGRWNSRNVAAKRFHCAVCDRAYPNKFKLDRHYKTDKHQLKAATARKAAESS